MEDPVTFPRKKISFIEFLTVSGKYDILRDITLSTLHITLTYWSTSRGEREDWANIGGPELSGR